MKNGSILKDDKGNVLHAHGGHMLKVGDWYYWYGENRVDDIFVSCYKTKDFKNFIFCNHVLTAKSKTQDCGKNWDISLTKPLAKGLDNNILRRINEKGEVLCNLERPKIVRAKNGKFVMWMHYENGIDYFNARCAVAICDTPDGDFTYLGSFNPCGFMSRDCTLYTENGKTYFISAANDNKDLHVYRLTGDCLDIESHVSTLFAEQLREAPAFFRRNGKTYVLTSWCTGWDPNQGKWAVADSIESDFSPLYDFGDSTTFFSQPAFVLALNDMYYYFGDRWGGHNEKYFLSSYIVLPICFDEDKPYIEYCDEIELCI